MKRLLAAAMGVMFVAAMAFPLSNLAVAGPGGHGGYSFGYGGHSPGHRGHLGLRHVGKASWDSPLAKKRHSRIYHAPFHGPLRYVHGRLIHPPSDGHELWRQYEQWPGKPECYQVERCSVDRQGKETCWLEWECH